LAALQALNTTKVPRMELPWSCFEGFFKVPCGFSVVFLYGAADVVALGFYARSVGIMDL
jgi:hypothetical protein